MFSEKNSAGENSRKAILNDEKVRGIKLALSAGVKELREIAADYGVSPSTISAIKNHYRWTHVKIKKEDEK